MSESNKIIIIINNTVSPISKSEERKRKRLEVQLVHLPTNKTVYRYHGIFLTISYYRQTFFDTANH